MADLNLYFSYHYDMPFEYIYDDNVAVFFCICTV